ncbi:MAG: hypothetical protein ACJ79H_18200 [Myxococcales bacterium]
MLAVTYVFTPVVVPGETIQQVFGLNDRGQTMVTTDKSSGTFRHGKLTPLPAPPSGFEVGGLGINNAGVITGIAVQTGGDSSEQGFVLRGSTYTFFSRPGFANTEPRAISNSGLVTGISANSDFSQLAGFIYDPEANTFTDATPAGSTSVIVQGMNAAGRICGDARQPGLGRYAFVWQQGTLQNRDERLASFFERVTIDGTATAARGINDAGVLSGFTHFGTAGFVGNASRGYRLLFPPGATQDGASTVCEGINNFDQVVCVVTDADGATHGFIGSPRDDDESERR